MLTLFLLFLLKIVMGVGEGLTFWSKTKANLDCNTRLNSKSFAEDVFAIDLEYKISRMLLKDNMPCIVDISRSA